MTLAEALERARVLKVRDDAAFDVTPHGARWFAERFEIDVAALAQHRRALAKRCLDWTERKPHLAGALGAALLDAFFERRWIARVRDTRAVRITSRGQTAIDALLASVDDARFRTAGRS